jgi:predicted nucleic acid-binding protein
MILVDTSALYALVSASDEFHPQAREMYRAILEGGEEILATSYVLVETLALVHRRLGFEVLLTLYDSIEGVIETLWVDEPIHQQAWQDFAARRGQGLSFVDWTTVVAAGRLGATVFAFDSDFASENLSVIP